jgi:hypothetical protein
VDGGSWSILPISQQGSQEELEPGFETIWVGDFQVNIQDISSTMDDFQAIEQRLVGFAFGRP